MQVSDGNGILLTYIWKYLSVLYWHILDSSKCTAIFLQSLYNNGLYKCFLKCSCWYLQYTASWKNFPLTICVLLVFCEFVWNFLNFNFLKKYMFLYIKACLFYLCKLATHGKKSEKKFLSSADIAGGSLFKSLEWSFM